MFPFTFIPLNFNSLEMGTVLEYNQESREAIFDYIVEEIVEGRPVRQILKDPEAVNASTFFRWLSENKDWQERYARALEVRADYMYDQIYEAAMQKEMDDETTVDHNGIKVVTKDSVQRSRLKVDALKWLAAKMAPEKYGDKIDITSKGKRIAPTEAPAWNFIDASKKQE